MAPDISFRVGLGGSVTLSSSNPFVQPKVDLAFLVEDMDTQIQLQAYKTAKAQIEHPIMKGFALGPVSPPPEINSDKDIILFMRNNTVATSHGTGTAAMSRKNGKEGVVDPSLKVKGVNGLRVIDASVFVSFVS
jgi:choline dehydrogenase